MFMKASWVLLLASLCWGALAGEASMEEACDVDGGCTKRSNALLQKTSSRSMESELVNEEDEEDDDDDEDALVDAEQETEKPDPGDPLKPCNKMKKKKVEKILARLRKREMKIHDRMGKCADKIGLKIDRLEKIWQHFHDCFNKYYGYGSFVADRVSEGAKGTQGVEAMAAEDLDELMMEAEDLDETDDEVQPGELKPRKPDGTGELKPRKPDGTGELKPKKPDGPRLPPCDKVDEKKAAKIVDKVEKKLEVLYKKENECHSKPTPKLERIEKKIKHFEACK